MSAREEATRGGGIVRVGVSGWRYGGWRGSFYPQGLLQRDELAYISRQVDTVEINGTHYSLQRPDWFAGWRDQTPDRFVFAVKGSRFVTHMKQLRDIEAPLANFFASGVLRLDDKLGPFLWQFSPRFRFDAGRLEAFFRLLPRDTMSAGELAKHHDHRVAGRAWSQIKANRPLRHAVEVRHSGFLDPGFICLLRQYNVALVFADAVDWPYAEDLTSDFVYLRLHGSKELYASGYSGTALARWARRITAWGCGGEPNDARLIDPGHRALHRPRDVFVYFDNDAKVRAPFDAQALRRKLRLPSTHPAPPRWHCR